MQQIVSILESALGSCTTHKKGELSFHCPKCNHYKKKLQVNYLTQSYHCWVCGFKGRSIVQLLRKVNAGPFLITKAKELVGDTTNHKSDKMETSLISLPTEFRPLHINWNTPHYKNALHYVLNHRKLTPIEILRYGIGYCEEGDYHGMVIVPSYNADNQLNYFVGRAFYDINFKHKNPEISRDVVGFENLIDWDQPITLVEGAFDAITTRRNTIPLFGKRILPKLRGRLIEKRVPRINLALDADALKDAISEVEYFMNNGIEVNVVKLPGKDPNEIGYIKTIETINKSTSVDLLEMIMLKMAI